MSCCSQAIGGDSRAGTDQLEVSAKRSEDGQTLVLQVVNLSDQSVPVQLERAGYQPSKPIAMVEELDGPLNGVNTAAEPRYLIPRTSEWRHGIANHGAGYLLKPHSFTVMRFQ